MKKIMVIDDSMLIRAFIKLNLEKLDFHVTEAENATTALNILNKENGGLPDMILVDINMPKINGYTFCRMVRENTKIKHIPLVIITSADSEWDRDHAKKCGADGFLTKPFPIEKVV